jgi:Spy/CpxP family protein refolding chaperone
MKRIAMFVLTASLLVSVTTLAFTATRESGGRAMPPAAFEPEGDDPGPMAGIPEPPDGFDPMNGAGARGPRGGGPGGPGAPMGPRPGFGGPGMPGGPMGPEELFDQLTGALALTDPQRDRLEKIRDEHVRDDIHARAELEIARLDLRRLVDADMPDRGAIDAQIDRLAQMEAGLHKSRVAMMLDSRAVLTAAQAKKLKELRGARGRDHGPDSGPPRTRGRGRTM